MSEWLSLDSFWNSAPSADTDFNSTQIAHLPDVAKRYLTHTIAPGTLLARAVRLRMHGEIKLKAWARFRAEEVIRSDRGLIWQAVARMKGLPVSGYDRFVDGAGEMRWKLLGGFASKVGVRSANGAKYKSQGQAGVPSAAAALGWKREAKRSASPLVIARPGL